MTFPVSILDLVPLGESSEGEERRSSGQALRNSLELAQLSDRLGYKRYWFAEHHNLTTIASTTPEIMIALAAEKTSRLRVGSGGVMLPNHAPLKVAETFKMLEALHPGRIDLGIGRAPGTDPATAAALRGGRSALGADRFPSQLQELLEYGEQERTQTVSPFEAPRTIVAVPQDVPLPPIWLLGSSDFSAHAAAMLGMGYAFAAHFSDFPPEGPLRDYRSEFAPSTAFPQPHAILALSVICAPTDDEAERLAASLLVAFARLRTGQKSILLAPEQALLYEFSPREQAVVDSIRGQHINGSPASVKPRIDELVQRTGADEVMVTTFVYNHADRMRSYTLLAEALGPLSP